MQTDCAQDEETGKKLKKYVKNYWKIWDGLAV